MTNSQAFVPLVYQRIDDRLMCQRAHEFYKLMAKRRSVRDFSADVVPQQVLEDAIRTAGSAPSGANMQPWHFAVVQNAELKRRIRLAAEAEERELYDHRASEEWLQALAPLGTDANKPFLEIAPALIAIFQKKFTLDEDGKKHKNYYTSESVGIATGMLIAALHNAGLATLTHTPSPMKFLGEILKRPSHERAVLLLVVGYPADGAAVPDIQKNPLEKIASFD